MIVTVVSKITNTTAVSGTSVPRHTSHVEFICNIIDMIQH